jgi:protein involved in polysaccharide export with SLBB domain
MYNVDAEADCLSSPFLQSRGTRPMHRHLSNRVSWICAIAVIVGIMFATTVLAQSAGMNGADTSPADAAPAPSGAMGATTTGPQAPAKQPTDQAPEESAGQPTPPPEDELATAPKPRPVTAPEIFASLPRFGENIFAAIRARETEEDKSIQEPDRQEPEQSQPVPESEDGANRRGRVESPLANVPVPADYQLGPADTVDVQVWNLDKQRAQKIATISADGYITLPVLGKLTINGMTMPEAQEHIRKRAATFYSDPQIVMELVRPRTVDVYVIGDVFEPGKYALPGNATVFTALYAAGGPSETGSYRRVQLTRRAEPAKTIDLYEYLMYGRRDADELLQAGDTVFVPPVRAEIGIAGAVRRPARYEILQPVSLQEAIDLASGFESDAHAADVSVWRPDQRDRWELHRIDATTEAGCRTVISSGTLIDVSPVLDRAPTTATLTGPVYRPGVYDVTPDLTVGRLIRRAQGPKDSLYMGRGDIWRLNDQYDYELIRFSPSEALAGHDDPAVHAGDIVYLYDEQRVAAPRTVEVSGQVREPGTYPFAQGMRVRDLILRAGDVLPGAYMPRAEVVRITEDQRKELIPVNLQEALAEDAGENIVLQPQDSLTVLQREAVADPSEVHIAGFVREPGTYPRYEGMRASDLIMAAGGLAPDAGEAIHYTAGHFHGEAKSVELSVEGGPEDFTIRPDVVLGDDDSLGVSGLSDFTVVPKMASITGEVARPGAYPLREGTSNGDVTDTVYELIRRAGGLCDTANPQGMILYRIREEIIPEERQDDLNYIFRMLNREKEETVAGLTSGDQAKIIANSAAEKATSEFGGLLGTESGALLVVPPRRLGIAQWIRAIPIDGDRILASHGEEGNLQLHQGDVLRVPEKVDFVTIVGSVSSPGAVQYLPGTCCDDYVDNAGGALPDADKSRMIVMRANGAVLPAHKAREVRAGDVIIVPSQHMFRTKHVDKPWLQSLTDLLSIGAAALLL